MIIIISRYLIIIASFCRYGSRKTIVPFIGFENLLGGRYSIHTKRAETENNNSYDEYETECYLINKKTGERVEPSWKGYYKARKLLSREVGIR